MALVDPAQNACKTLFREATITAIGSDSITVEYAASTYILDWVYHCPGGTEASSPSEGYIVGDKVLIELDEDLTPKKVVGHSDGARMCNIYFCFAYILGSTLYFKYSQYSRSQSIASPIQAAYTAAGETYTGIQGYHSVVFANNWPFRAAVLVSLLPTDSVYPLGRYAVVVISVDPYDNFAVSVENVYFYGLHAENEAGDDYYQYGCSSGVAIESQTSTWGHACDFSVEHEGCERIYAETCVRDQYTPLDEFDPCGDPEIVPCPCHTWYCGGTCAGTGSTCGSSYSTGIYDGAGFECTTCKVDPIPIGITLEDTGVPIVTMAGQGTQRYIRHGGSCSGTACGTSEENCPDYPCTVTVNESATTTPSNPCWNPLNGDIHVYSRGADAIGAGVSLGAEDAFLDMTSTWPLVAWSVGNPSGSMSTCDGHDWGPYTYGHTVTFDYLVGTAEFSYSYTKFRKNYEGVPQCVSEAIEREFEGQYGFAFTFPDPPEGQDPTLRGWQLAKHIWKSTYENYVFCWNFNFFRCHNGLGTGLELASGLDSPLDNPDKVACVISDLDNYPGFAVCLAKSKVRAYAGWELDVNGKLSPIGDYVWEWSIGFGSLSIFRSRCAFAVHQLLAL